MSVEEGSAARADAGGEPLAPTGPGCPGEWSSEPAPGAKLCTLRLEAVQLVHTGLAPGWEASQTGELLLEAAAELTGGPGPGGAGGLPPAVRGWLEALRYAQEEAWPEAESPGTTLALEAGGALWVLTRGVHEVEIRCEAGEQRIRELVEPPEGCRVWKLDPLACWRVDVALPGALSPIWTARWRSPLVAMPEMPPAARAAREAAAVPPGPPSALQVAAQRLSAPLRRLLVAHPRAARTTALGFGVVLALLLVLALLPRRAVTEAWTRLGDVAWGRYRARIESVPPGARVLLDGRETGVVTPGWLLVREGPHRVEISLGEYGAASLPLDGRRGARVARRASILGKLAIGSADPGVTLYARLDGRPIGRLPALLDSVPAGRRVLTVQGRDVRPWTEEVGVVAGRTTQVLARPEKVPETGVVVARAYRVGKSGLTDLAGATLYLDGKRAGVTPLRLPVPRGQHTARLVADGVRSPVQLLRVEGGQEIFATAEFGRSPEPEVVDELLGKPAAGQPPLVRARLESPMPLRITGARLHVRRYGREFVRVPMSLQARGGQMVAEVELPLKGLEAGARASYFVILEVDDGEEFVSEMRAVTLVP